MAFDARAILEILQREHYVTEEDVARILTKAEQSRRNPLELLIEEDLISYDLAGQAIAESLKIPYADLNSNPPSAELVRRLPEALATEHQVVFFREDQARIIAAAAEPNPALLGLLKPYAQGKEVGLAYGWPAEIRSAFVYYRKPLETRFSEIIKSERRVAPEIVKQVIEDALLYHASDVHCEPTSQEVLIRFRIDGVLHEAGRLSREPYEGILNRIKVEAGLRIDEHFAAQDGAIRYEIGGQPIDLRVSIVPILDGEKVAIRILSRYVGSFNLAVLGLSARDRARLVAAARKPFGMILVSGPTGSGKTTTLYAMLKLISQPEVHVMTIEDPVEYRMSGINQIQVNPATNLTFAQGLRSIVRQDPNIILVGEIRDRETAEIGVNAALTGHLLFSTFHSNDAATAIPRLLDMGVEPFLLASTLELVVAQRLVRRICEQCRVSYQTSAAELGQLLPTAREYFEDGLTLYRGKGCEKCHGSGFSGRLAIFELIEVSVPMKELILRRPAMAEIWQLARAEGARSLFEDGIDKVKNGLTTLEELLRVAAPPAIGDAAKRKRG